MITPNDMDRFTNNQIVNMYGELNQNLTKTIIRKLRKDGDISSYTQAQMRALKKTGGEQIFKEALRKTTKITPQRKKEITALFDEIGGKTNNLWKQLKPQIENSQSDIDAVNYYKKRILNGDHRKILINSNNEILDGNHTMKAYQELNIEPPKIYRGERKDFYKYAYETGGDAEKAIDEMIKNGVAEKVDFSSNPAIDNILDYAKRTANKDLSNLTGSIAYKTKTTYIKAIDRVYKEVATGAYDYNTSIKRAVRDLAQQGVKLKNSIGHQEQLDVAVKRALYTGIQRTAKDIAKQVGSEIDANCVVIGHSEKCRPTHHPIDAVTMSLDEFEKYEYLTEEYNCNHIVNYDWQPEFDKEGRKVEYHDDRISYEDTLRNYKIQQKANYYARQVRSKKSDIASGDNTKKAKTRLRLAQKKYREFCKQNDMEVDYLQTWKVGYNK